MKPNAYIVFFSCLMALAGSAFASGAAQLREAGMLRPRSRAGSWPCRWHGP